MTNLQVVDTQTGEMVPAARHIGERIPADLAEVNQFAQLFIQSGLCSDVSQVASAAVKILRGAELGITPFAAMQGLHIIKGQVTMSANIMATLIQRSAMRPGRKYDYRVLSLTDIECKIEYFVHRGQEWESLGISTWTKADADRAGTNLREKFPRNMNFARAMANGFRTYTPELSCGMPAYAPEEFDAETDKFGRIIETEFTPNTQSEPVQEQQQEVKPEPPKSKLTQKQVAGLFAQKAKENGFEHEGNPELRYLAKLLLGVEPADVWAYQKANELPESDWQAAVQKANMDISEVKIPAQEAGAETVTEAPVEDAANE